MFQIILIMVQSYKAIMEHYIQLIIQMETYRQLLMIVYIEVITQNVKALVITIELKNKLILIP